MINTKIKSLNHSKKTRKFNKIRFLIFHYTGMQSKRESIKRLTNLRHKVSCHYLVDRKGEVFQLVEDLYVAWHAGKSKWKKLKNLNENSVGIELVNKGHRLGYQKFSSMQIKTLVELCLILKKKYKIKSSCVLGHSDISPLRKIDPGEKFPWKHLSKKGIAIWYPNIKNIKNIKNNLNKKKN